MAMTRALPVTSQVYGNKGGGLRRSASARLDLVFPVDQENTLYDAALCVCV